MTEQTTEDLEAELIETRRQLDEFLEKQARLDVELQRRRKALREQQEQQSRDNATGQTLGILQGLSRNAQEVLTFASQFAWFDHAMEHQKFGVLFGALAKRWILADEPGLGKSFEAIAWLDLVRSKRALVLVPAEICDQFEGEFVQWAPEREIYNLYKTGPIKRHELLDAALANDQGVVILNYEMLSRDEVMLAKLIHWHLDAIVCDEAHLMKSTTTANYRYTRMLVEADNVCPRCGTHLNGLYNVINKRVRGVKACPTCGWKASHSAPTDYRTQLELKMSSRSVKNLLFMTGTPILNSPMDLYPLLHLADPVLYPTQDRFQRSFLFLNRYTNKWEFRPGGLERLRDAIGGRYLARTKQDAGVELPEQYVHIVPVPITKETHALQYRTIRQITEAAQILLSNGQKHTIMHMLALMTRKRQANVWPAGIKIMDKDENSPTFGQVLFDVGDEVQESAKLDAVMREILDHPDERQVVFSQFKTALAELERRLKEYGVRVVRLDGDTPEKLRKQIKNNFYASNAEKPKWDVLLANYKTGGTGLNLTSVTIGHELDQEWNPGKRDQARDRYYRIGQTQETHVYKYESPKTIDTWMSKLMARKEHIVSGFSDTMTVERFKEALDSGEML